MKKTITILLALSILLTGVFAACSKKTDTDTAAESEQGIEDANADFGFEMVPVTDENGEEVTDENGEVATTEVAVKYELDKKGRTVAKVIDENGEVATNKHGKEVTIKTDVKITTTKKKKNKNDKSSDNNGNNGGNNGNAGGNTTPTSSTETTTAESKKGDQTTEPEVTTKKDMESVPNTNDSGERVVFSSDDQQIIKNMLEVPYLFVSSYENSEGVHIDAASHAALWMLEREGISTESYAAGTVVIDLFKYYGQTVINFKTRLNSEGDNENFTYHAKTDTFTVSSFEAKVQDVSIDHIEDLGYGNYYKVVGTVKNAELDGKEIDKVIAIFQRNRLDNTLGFSLKAVQWS